MGKRSAVSHPLIHKDFTKEGFAEGQSEPFEYEADSPWLVLTPLILLVILVAGGVYGYLSFLAPDARDAQASRSSAMATLEPYSGLQVVDKAADETCLTVTVIADSGDEQGFCVPEELWSAQAVGEPLRLDVLAESWFEKSFDSLFG